MVEILDDDNFGNKIMESKMPVIVDFFANWCGPCKMMAPVFESLAKDYAGKIAFYKVDVDDAPQTSNLHFVQSIPTIVVFVKGKELDRMVGFVDADTLKIRIEKMLSA